MQQIDVDRIENEKFIQAQREATEKADREAKLAFVPVSEEVAAPEQTPEPEIGEPVSEEVAAPKKRGK